MKKALIVGTLALSALGFSSSAEAAPKKANLDINRIGNISTMSSCNVLYCDSKSGSGRVYYDFRYFGSEDSTLRINIQNSGKKAFTIKVTNPDGFVMTSGITVDPGENLTYSFVANSHGIYQVRLDNDDGSNISSSLRVRAL
ncbi:cupredoxin domain-containing protein [Bacillus pumilus]|uniref:hypothetical protein n=1 Tax=Bacillus pumilus TaxID=1408 RepID=UPI0011A31CB0|nr:hypothetical protein [Bacillus pumilus]